MLCCDWLKAGRVVTEGTVEVMVKSDWLSVEEVCCMDTDEDNCDGVEWTNKALVVYWLLLVGEAVLYTEDEDVDNLVVSSLVSFVPST